MQIRANVSCVLLRGNNMGVVIDAERQRRSQSSQRPTEKSHRDLRRHRATYQLERSEADGTIGTARLFERPERLERL
jgi:hypothetical protein